MHDGGALDWIGSDLPREDGFESDSRAEGGGVGEGREEADDVGGRGRIVWASSTVHLVLHLQPVNRELGRHGYAAG